MPEANNDTSIAVLLPCYNEEVTIGKVVRDFKAALPKATVYVYDNNSTDRTAEIAAAEGAIVRKEPRQGKGNVIRAMFEDIHLFPREQASVPQFRQPFGARLHQRAVRRARHRYHDRIPRVQLHLRQDLSRTLARLRGRDRDDNPLAEQQPATLRDANPVP